nr:hypothetical protein [Tanacetum cinerariifolium]
MSFSKRPGTDVVCYTKPLDSLKGWNDHFLWVDTSACSSLFSWHTSKSVSREAVPKSSEFNAEHYATLVAYPAPFHKEDELYFGFWARNLVFGLRRTVDPTKIRIGEREHDENEPKLLETTVGRVVLLLPVAPDRSYGELKASVDKLFNEEGSGEQADQGDSASGGHGVGVQPVNVIAEAVVEDVALAKLQRKKKRKTKVVHADEPSHLAKKLRGNYGVLGEPTIGGKSQSVVKHLLVGVVQHVEVRGGVMPTFLFVSSSIFTTPEREGGDHTKLLAGANLCTLEAPQRFVVSSDSSDHSGVNIAKAEVDSIVRTFVPIMTSATSATPTDNPTATANERLVGSLVFGGDFSFTGESHPIFGGFLSYWCDEIKSLKAQLIVKEAEAVEAVRFCDEAQALKDRNTNLEKEKVHKLEASAVGLQEKVIVYENCMSQLEKFQDEKIEEVNEKFDKLCADFIEMDLHLEEKFYPYLLTTISGRRWLLTHGMELAITKCLNSTEYLSALRAAIGKAIEKGMQEGLSAGITHGAGGRTLTGFAAYNPSMEADYLSALQCLQSVNFPLITKLKPNKDASVEMIINLLRLEDALTKKLGLVESQPHVDQLMVPIHHSPDQCVVGAYALSLLVYVSSSHVRRIRENIANHVLALRGIFVPVSEPLSTMALEGMEGTSGAAPDTTTALSITSVSASTIPPISTDDYEIAHTEVANIPCLRKGMSIAVSKHVCSFAQCFRDFVRSLLLRSELAFVFHMACFVVPFSRLASAGITASAPYVNENGVSLLLDLIMTSVCPFYQAIGLGMFNGGEALADT